MALDRAAAPDHSMAMNGRPRSDAPRRTEVIKILVTPSLDALVTAAAKREGRSVSDWGQRLFEREVVSHGNAVENTDRSSRNPRRAKR